MKRERKRLTACLLTITMLFGCLGIPVNRGKGSRDSVGLLKQKQNTAVTPLRPDDSNRA